jgi:hypothetical protein
MTRVEYYGKDCQKRTKLIFTPVDRDRVRIEITTDCENLRKALDEYVLVVDSMREMFSAQDSQLTAIAERLPHRACPFLFAAIKGLHVEADLQKAEDIIIEVEKIMAP